MSCPELDDIDDYEEQNQLSTNRLFIFKKKSSINYKGSSDCPFDLTDQEESSQLTPSRYSLKFHDEDFLLKDQEKNVYSLDCADINEGSFQKSKLFTLADMELDQSHCVRSNTKNLKKSSEEAFSKSMRNKLSEIKTLGNDWRQLIDREFDYLRKNSLDDDHEVRLRSNSIFEKLEEMYVISKLSK